MSAVTFLCLLSAFAVVTGLFTEAIKKLVNDKANLSYNITSLIIALIVGIVGSLTFYRFNSIEINADNIILAIYMGIAASLASQLGYDKIKQAIEQLVGGEK